MLPAEQLHGSLHIAVELRNSPDQPAKTVTRMLRTEGKFTRVKLELLKAHDQLAKACEQYIT